MNSTVGQRLAFLRDSDTQKDFASRLGVGVSSYARYERGERLPDAEMLVSLCVMGFNINWLLTGIPNNPLPKNPPVVATNNALELLRGALLGLIEERTRSTIEAAIHALCESQPKASI